MGDLIPKFYINKIHVHKGDYLLIIFAVGILILIKNKVAIMVKCFISCAKKSHSQSIANQAKVSMRTTKGELKET